MKKTAWPILILLIAAALVLASCTSATTVPTAGQTVTGTTTQSTTTTTTTTATTTTPTTTTTTEPVVDPNEPIYGGTLTMIGGDPNGFDPALVMYNQQSALKLVVETLATLDWWKGPAGTNEWSFEAAWAEPPEDIKKGLLVESWELVTETHAIYHVREGVMWQDRPGIQAPREVTATDLAFSINRLLGEPTNYWHGVTGTPISATVIDRYTFEVRYEVPEPRMWAYLFMQLYSHVAPDVIEEFGDMTDWRTLTGTGPFILTDYVEDSALIYKRNPNYWQKDPEGRSLPYLSVLELLVIPDLSTRISALRTGQIDILASIGYEDSQSLGQTNPELAIMTMVNPTAKDIELNQRSGPFSPTDDPDAYKVRLAASIAIDREAIIEEYYLGQAVPNAHQMAPVYNIEAIQFENLPESIAKFYEYDPERAKELLAEAGYPEGFKLVLHVGGAAEAEYYALIKSYWDAVGIETELDVIDSAVFWGMIFNQKWEGAMGALAGVGMGVNQHLTQPDGKPFAWNVNASICEICDELFIEMAGSYAWEDRIRLTEEITLAGLATGDKIYLPSTVINTYWQPWVKGYLGQAHVGIGDTYGIAAYIWVDESLK